MGRIGRTYPRHYLMTPSAPAAPVRRLPLSLWLCASLCLLLLAWPLS
jgi:hypothetical protein